MESQFLTLLLGCAVAVLSAIGVVLARRPIYAALGLLVHSLSLAALYAILSAALVAVGQLIIYSGAIVVLFLFVVTLLPAGGRELSPTGSRFAAACVAGGGLIVALAAALVGGGLPAITATPDLGVAAVGHALFGSLLVAFELTAPLLLVAIIAAVVIWRRHEPRSRMAIRTEVTTPRRVVMHR